MHDHGGQDCGDIFPFFKVGNYELSRSKQLKYLGSTSTDKVRLTKNGIKNSVKKYTSLWTQKDTGITISVVKEKYNYILLKYTHTPFEMGKYN